MKKIIGVALLSFLLIGCDKPKIDASTEEAMQSSIAKVRESLPEDQRGEFDKAIQTVVLSNLNMSDLMHASSENGKEEISKKMREPLSGKTGAEVISYAQSVVAERELKQKEQALQEIKELESQKAEAAKAKEELKKFQVLASRFTMEPQQYGQPQPVIRLVVKNNTDKAISRAFFHGVIASEGRSVPWFEGDFNYEISGGLEPNEEATWALAPNQFSEWGKIDAPADAVFTVTVTKINGADKKPLFDTSGFSDQDNSRLEDLKKKYR